MKTNHIIKIGLLAGLTVSTGCGDSFLDVTSHTQDFVETTRYISVNRSLLHIAHYNGTIGMEINITHRTQ